MSILMQNRELDDMISVLDNNPILIAMINDSVKNGPKPIVEKKKSHAQPVQYDRSDFTAEEGFNTAAQKNVQAQSIAALLKAIDPSLPSKPDLLTKKDIVAILSSKEAKTMMGRVSPSSDLPKQRR